MSHIICDMRHLPERIPTECLTTFGSRDFKDSPNSLLSNMNLSWHSNCIIV